MGKFKDLIIKFDEDHSELERDNDKYFFILDLWIKCRLCEGTSIKENLTGFFNDIFPTLKDNECIWCMASSSDGVSYNFSYKDREQALQDLSVLSGEDVNLYFSPAIFTGWRTDNNVSKINTIYIDIDDIDGMDFSEMDREDIEDWLIDTYCLDDDDILPDWIVASGHGLHLYWIVDEIDLRTDEGTALRKIYTDYLITWFKADVSCRNKSRILRFPTSRNVKHKEDVRITRLFRLNKSKSKDISRLDFFQCSDEAIEFYTSENIRKRSEKRKATMMKNGTWKERKTAAKETKDTPKKPKKASEHSLGTKEKKKGFERVKGYIPNESPRIGDTKTRYGTVIKEPITSSLSPKSRYRRIIRDLQNYAIRRYTVPEGYRSIFCHILAVYMKKARFSLKDAEAIVYGCVDDDFLNEADSILKNVYDSKTEYTYTNERIAELLDFKACDLEQSYACYTEEQREERRKQSNSRYDDKRYKEKRTAKEDLKEYRKAFIKEHTEMTAKQLSEALGCSERTIRYIKSDIRKNS